MKHQISLSIPSPCTEKWENFSETSIGGFCQSCQKNVVDFTQMSDLEMINYWKTANKNTCGRFQENQLKTYRVFETEPSKKRFQWLKAATASIILFWANADLRAQEQTKPNTSIEYNKSIETATENQESTTFEGIVRNEYGESMPGVTVMLEGTTLGTSTDIDGKFVFPKELKKGDVLISSFIGYESVRYVIKEQEVQNLEFQFAEITFDSCDMILMGDISFDHVYEPQNSFLGRVWNKVNSVF